MNNSSRTCAKCGASGNNSGALKFHRFPLVNRKNFERVKKWALWCFTGEDFSTYESVAALYAKNKYICSRHFAKEMIYANGHLSKNAVPTIEFKTVNQLSDSATVIPADTVDTSMSQLYATVIPANTVDTSMSQLYATVIPADTVDTSMSQLYATVSPANTVDTSMSQLYATVIPADTVDTSMSQLYATVIPANTVDTSMSQSYATVIPANTVDTTTPRLAATVLAADIQEDEECMEAECCHMCFSTDRKLSTLDGVVDIYLLIVGLSPDCGDSVKEVRACWECRAVLQRILKFRRQAQWARDVLLTADALLLDSDLCMSKLKCTVIEKIDLKNKLDLVIVRDVSKVQMGPKRTENVNESLIYDDSKGSSDSNSSHGVFGQDDSEQHIEANTNADNMYQAEEKELICSMNNSIDIDPLAMEVKEEDDIDEGDVIDAEPACDQDQTNNDEKPISDVQIDMRKCNNLISNIKTIDDLSQTYNNQQAYGTLIPVTVLDNHNVGLTGSQPLMIVIDPGNLSKLDLTPTRENDKMFIVKDNLDKGVVANQRPEGNYVIANSVNMNMVESMQPPLNIQNIQLSSLQPVNIQLLDKIQPNLFTVSNISPLQVEKQDKVHLSNTAQNSQHSTIVKTKPLAESVLSNGTGQYNGNFRQMDLTPREVKIVKTDENIAPVMKGTRKIQPQSMNVNKSFRRTAKSKLTKIRVTKVTRSQLNDFLEQARNNEMYLASPFKCKFCILGFKEERFLQRHMIRYRHEKISKNEFVCDICHSSMPSKRELNIHQSIHDCLYSCTLDDFTSVLPLNVYHHCTEKHSSNKKCKTPLKGTKTTAGRKRKRLNGNIKKVKQMKYEVFKPTKEDFECMRASRWSKGMQCEDCGLAIKYSEKLKEHRQSHSENAGAHVCDLCKLRFPTAELLRQHTPEHDEWYRCKADPACLYVAQKLHTLQRHIYAKHSTKSIRTIGPHVSHECSICKKVFMRSKSLKSHMWMHNKQLMCDVCGFFARNDTVLARHKLQHTSGERDYFICEFCPKRYTCKANLRYHRSRHLKIKAYDCKLCDEKFYSPKSRNCHVRRVHKKKRMIKSHKCTVCLVVFPSETSLYAHRTTHEELQRHKCDKCPKGFYIFNHLLRHQDTHMYNCKCGICGKVLANRDTLKYHLRSMHNEGTETQQVKRENLRECNECGKMFRSVKKWRDHMKTHLIFPEDAPELS